MKESIFLDQIRDIFAILDRGIYGLISIFYDTIEQLATTEIISGSSINDIATKIYGLLAIFMIFKISFSLINFLVNPDLISDKTKGGGALIKNIIITFVLIISVPFAFDLLYRAQRVIISDGIIQKYILGGNTEEAGYSIKMSDECDTEATTNKVGDYIGLMAFKPFFQLSEDKNGNDFDSIKNQYCKGNIAATDGNASVSNLLKNRDVYDAPHGISFDHYYVVEYTIFLSSAIGIVIALLFLKFCFDVAVRTIKLYFLEIIAPVPIISYIDPDSSKNGMFKKWLKEVFNTWMSLFIRLAAIYFAIYIIGMLANMDIPGDNLWIKLLIIIGALIFAKQVPKMIEDILGIKMGKDFTLNPLKNIRDNSLGGKFIAGAVTGATGMGLASIGSAGANALAAKPGNKFKSGLKGLGTGAYYGATGGYKAGKEGKYNPFTTTLSSIEKNSKMRNMSEDLSKQGIKKGPFNVPRYMAENKYTDIIGKRGSSGSTDILKDKISGLNIREQIANQKQVESSRLISEIKSKYSDNTNISNMLSDAFRRDAKKDINDKVIRDDSGRVEWTTDISSMTASNYASSKGITFDNDTEKNIFESAFNSMKNAERDYREAYNDSLEIEKTKTKLEKQKGKIDDLGKK